MKRVLSILLICVMVFAFAPSFAKDTAVSENGVIVAEAKTKSKIKLNYKSKEVYIGSTFTLKVKGTKKKVKWSSSNKKVAKVNKKGKVKALSKGTAKICAKIGKKKLYCKVTVEEKPTKPGNISISNPNYLKDICAMYYDLGMGEQNGIVGEIRNYNHANLEVTMTVTYFDNNTFIETGRDTNVCLSEFDACSLHVGGPVDNFGNPRPYTSYKVELSAKEVASNIIDRSLDVKLYYGPIVAERTLVMAQNLGENTIDRVHASIVYYDKTGKCIGQVSSEDIHCDNPGDVGEHYFYNPLDLDGNPIVAATYRVFIDSAYSIK